VTVRGRASHSSSPARGLNAIDGAVQVLQRLASLRTEPPDRWLGEPTVTPTSLHTGPDATHTVQDTAVLTIDRRLVGSVEADEAVAGIRQAIGDLSPFGVDVALGPFIYPAPGTRSPAGDRVLGARPAGYAGAARRRLLQRLG
jgi:acetylornithine deacetylase/succinyl-diaminopimelate desuccinylase-like protein